MGLQASKHSWWQRGVFLLSVALLAAVALWLWNGSPEENPAAQRPAPQFRNPAESGASGNSDPVGSDAQSPAFSPPPLRVWEKVDESSVDALPDYKEVVAGRVLVRLAEAAGGWAAGSELDFEVPQLGQTFPGVIERAEEDPWGNRSFVGLLREPDGSEYRFVVTLGARNQFANFGTSSGAFELVAADGLGWLMPTANMDQHVDYSRPDYYIPDRRRRR